MEREAIREQIKLVLTKVLKHQNFNMKDEMMAPDVEGWDSLTHMIIISEIEQSFKVKFKLKDLNKLNNMGNLIDLVNSKLEQNG